MFYWIVVVGNFLGIVVVFSKTISWLGCWVLNVFVIDLEVVCVGGFVFGIKWWGFGWLRSDVKTRVEGRSDDLGFV